MRVTMGLCLLLAAGCDDGIRIKPGTGTTNPAGGSGAGTTPTGAGSCDRRSTDSVCIDYRGSGWDPTQAESSCGVDWSPVSCPPSDIGGCQLAPTDPLDIITWYYQGAVYVAADEPSLQSQCEGQGGTWR